MSAERGSAAILLLAVAGLVVVLTIGVADVGLALAARLQAAAAADAAALGAAPVTFRPFGATGSPAAEAGRLAAANGAVLASCRCPIDRSWRSRVVEVAVQRRVSLLGLGSITVRASSQAEFDPARLLEVRDPGAMSADRGGTGELPATSIQLPAGFPTSPHLRDSDSQAAPSARIHPNARVSPT